jgi:hypothetical protein
MFKIKNQRVQSTQNSQDFIFHRRRQIQLHVI